MLKKIGVKNQKKIDWAKSHGVNLIEIVNLYGLRFAMKLLKWVTRAEYDRDETTSPPIPKFKVGKANQEKALEQYWSVLKDCGFRLRTRFEDFIDEDTGNVVSIERVHVYYINPVTKKYRLGNQNTEYKLVTEYLGWLPKDGTSWDDIFPIMTISSELRGKEFALVSPDKLKEVIFIIVHRITKDAFPMSFYSEERANDWHQFCIVYVKDDSAEEKVIIPLH